MEEPDLVPSPSVMPLILSKPLIGLARLGALAEAALSWANIAWIRPESIAPTLMMELLTFTFVMDVMYQQ
jgi:hypothetical protein